MTTLQTQILTQAFSSYFTQKALGYLVASMSDYYEFNNHAERIAKLLQDENFLAKLNSYSALLEVAYETYDAQSFVSCEEPTPFCDGIALAKNNELYRIDEIDSVEEDEEVIKQINKYALIERVY